MRVKRLTEKMAYESALFGLEQGEYALPSNYQPTRPRHFKPDRIFLSKGSLATLERSRFVEDICRVYPEASVIECPDIPHNRISLNEKDYFSLFQKGKQTLVFGEHKSAVRFAEEQGNTCPNYWHFSPYGFCFYNCKYCYLAGTKGVWHFPAVKIFVNLDEIMREINRVAMGLKKPTAFYLGKLQDGIALDPLTAYSTVLIPFFARHEFARQVILTKSTEVDRLLKLNHQGHTILSWSINPPEIISQFEEKTPSMDERLRAMKQCAEKGYPIRAVLMPIIPVSGWKEIYFQFLQSLFSQINLQRLTLGGICIYQNAKLLMERKLGYANQVSKNLNDKDKGGDGRIRYSAELRIKLYSEIIKIAREIKPGLEIALCLEEPQIWKALKLESGRGQCNCVL